ncbi:MAG TPA: cytochrome c [Candidatus Tumulicola sp.]|nr:cytochrome c [Candidatus Tumulicola sp.]
MLRRLFLIVLGIVGLAVIAIVALYAIGSAALDKTYAIAPSALDLTIPSDKASIARGKHWATSLAKCADCHAADLGGGGMNLDVPPFHGVAPNLTRGQGGIGATFTNTDYVRAIRHGLDESGHALIIMPSDQYTSLSDQDLADIIAYVKSVPPVNRELPDTTVKPLGRILMGAGMLPPPPATVINHDGPWVAVMKPAASVEYGRYLAMTNGCTGCHGAGLSGGPIPGLPPSAPKATNITPTGIGGWSAADLTLALRTGKRPNGTTINPFMPWAATAKMTDQEMKALVMYVRSVPPRPTGTR